MKIVKLTIDEKSELEGIDAVALVSDPAIEMDFMFFSKEKFQETYNDYPKAARAAAEQGIKRNEALGNKCGTQVGKVRAQQLAQGKPVSIDTIKRMRSFLLRQKDNYELAVRRKNYDACGYISYLLWGGPAALPWAEKKLRQAGKLQESNEQIIRDEFAEVGPRGGIKRSPKAPKSDTKNPNPKGRGTARGKAGTTRGAKVDKKTEATLKKKADDFNERYKKKLGYGANVGALKSVYQRGLGAYNTSRSPEVAKVGGAKRWAQARVNAFLYLLKNGRPQNKKYTTDYDLLPAKHPKSEKQANSVSNLEKDTILQYDKKNPYRGPGNYNFADQQMIDGIPVFPNEEQANQLAKKIGCVGSHKHTIGGEIVYMPCETHTEATDKLLKTIEENIPVKAGKEKYFEELSDDKQAKLLDTLKSTGKTADDMFADGWVELSEEEFNNSLYHEFTVSKADSNPDELSLQDTNLYKVLYEYKGPKDSKNRTFCRQLLDLNLLYRLEDINNMSLRGANGEFSTYDIFKYKGSYNCRHRWVQKFFTKNKPVDEQKRSQSTNTDLLDIIGGPRALAGGQLNPKARTQAEVEAGVPEGTFQFKAIGDKMELAGPLMIPDKLIPRVDKDGEKYYVFFDAEGIKKLSYKLMENKLIDAINIEHDPDRKVDDISLVETWLVGDPKKDKSNTYGYELPAGSWFGVYKVNNQNVWDDYIKTGKVKGFSVEGIFADKTILEASKKQYYAYSKTQ